MMLMAGHIGFEMQAVGTRDGVVGISTIFGGIGPDELGLCQVLFAIKGHDVVVRRPSPRSSAMVRTAKSGS